jgi:hypothetical protein
VTVLAVLLAVSTTSATSSATAATSASAGFELLFVELTSGGCLSRWGLSGRGSSSLCGCSGSGATSGVTVLAVFLAVSTASATSPSTATTSTSACFEFLEVFTELEVELIVKFTGSGCFSGGGLSRGCSGLGGCSATFSGLLGVAVLAVFLAMSTASATSSTTATTSTSASLELLLVEFTGSGCFSRCGFSWGCSLCGCSGAGLGSLFGVTVLAVLLAVSTASAASPSTAATSTSACFEVDFRNVAFSNHLGQFTNNLVELRGFKLSDIVVNSLLTSLEFHVSITGKEGVRFFKVVSEHTGCSNNNSSKERDGCRETHSDCV